MHASGGAVALPRAIGLSRRVALAEGTVMSNPILSPVRIVQYVHDEAGLVEYRIRWTAEIDAVAAKAAAELGVNTETLIGRAVLAAAGLQAGPVTVDGGAKH